MDEGTWPRDLVDRSQLIRAHYYKKDATGQAQLVVTISYSFKGEDQLLLEGIRAHGRTSRGEIGLEFKEAWTKFLYQVGQRVDIDSVLVIADKLDPEDLDQEELADVVRELRRYFYVMTPYVRFGGVATDGLTDRLIFKNRHLSAKSYPPRPLVPDIVSKQEMATHIAIFKEVFGRRDSYRFEDIVADILVKPIRMLNNNLGVSVKQDGQEMFTLTERPREPKGHYYLDVGDSPKNYPFVTWLAFLAVGIKRLIRLNLNGELMIYHDGIVNMKDEVPNTAYAMVFGVAMSLGMIKSFDCDTTRFKVVL